MVQSSGTKSGTKSMESAALLNDGLQQYGGNEQEEIDEDDYIEAIGGCGRFQVGNTALAWLGAAIVSCHVMVMYYVNLAPSLECQDPSVYFCNNDDKPTVKDFCDGVDDNWTNPAYPDWILQGPDSIQSEWNLACTDNYKVPLSESVFFLGWLAGGASCGKIGDKHGRRLPLAAYILLCSAALCLTTAAPNIDVFILFKAFHGFFVGPLLLTNYVYGSEFVPSKRSAFFGTMYFMLGAAGCAGLAGVARMVQDWRKFSFLVAGLTAPLAIWPILFPESPMWLLSVGKLNRALSVFSRVAKVNGKDLPSGKPRSAAPTIAGDESSCALESAPPAVSAFVILTQKGIRHTTWAMMFVWLVCSLCYFGLSLSGATLPGDAYLNAALLSCAELPAYPIQLLAVDSPVLGRKYTMLASLLVGAACCFMTLIPGLSGASAWLAFAGNMFVTGAYTTTYIWAAEIFPADVRASGLGFCTVGGKVGSSITPFIVDVATSNLSLAMAMFGGVALAGAAVALVLPETRGQVPYQTLAEMLNPREEEEPEFIERQPTQYSEGSPTTGAQGSPTEVIRGGTHFAVHRRDSRIATAPCGRPTLLPLPFGRPKSYLGYTVSPVSHARRNSFGHPFLTG
ncbi:Organic cation/carnitine transporter 4 [Diplonema papillatum]|nr:Organic cation/carnitine transporter 4 [Diplonema papillatum]|eukprot:gene22646-34660_t